MDSYICTSSQNNNAIAAKLHIEDIRKRKFSIGESRPNPLTEDLQNAGQPLLRALYQRCPFPYGAYPGLSLFEVFVCA